VIINFLFWEILIENLGCCNQLIAVAYAKKPVFTSRYKRLLAELRLARESAGITQVQAAKRFNTHASFISKVESGERRLDVIELADFCNFYGIRLMQLLERAGLV
jgi:hypothetical protein